MDPIERINSFGQLKVEKKNETMEIFTQLKNEFNTHTAFMNTQFMKLSHDESDLDIILMNSLEKENHILDYINALIKNALNLYQKVTSQIRSTLENLSKYNKQLEESIVLNIQLVIGKLPLFQTYIQEKVYIKDAPNYVDLGNRKLIKVPLMFPFLMLIYGTIVNQKLEGRGVVFCSTFIEDGFFENGSLTWGTRIYKLAGETFIEKADRITPTGQKNFYWNYSEDRLPYQIVACLEDIGF